MKTLSEAIEQKYPKYVKLAEDYSAANNLKYTADWRDITKLGLNNFVDYLQENNAASSAKTYAAMFKAVLNAYCEEVDLPKDFMRILSLKGCISQNTWLSDYDIEKLIAYEPINKIEQLVRNQFVIGCVSGCRYSDIIKLTKANFVGERLVYVSQKTKIKAEIPLSGIIVKFIDDLEFVKEGACPNTANTTIREICRKCGINEQIKLFRHGEDQQGEKWEFISFHSARRSFATNMYLRGVDLFSISKLMGHSDITTTTKYIVCPPKLTDKAMEYFKQFD